MGWPRRNGLPHGRSRPSARPSLPGPRGPAATRNPGGSDSVPPRRRSARAARPVPRPRLPRRRESRPGPGRGGRPPPRCARGAVARRGPRGSTPRGTSRARARRSPSRRPPDGRCGRSSRPPSAAGRAGHPLPPERSRAEIHRDRAARPRPACCETFGKAFPSIGAKRRVTLRRWIL